MAALYFLVDTILTFAVYAFLLRVMLQIVRADFRNPLAQAVVALTNPLVLPLRRVLPPIGRADTASIVALIVVQLGATIILTRFANPGVPLALLPLVISASSAASLDTHALYGVDFRLRRPLPDRAGRAQSRNHDARVPLRARAPAAPPHPAGSRRRRFLTELVAIVGLTAPAMPHRLTMLTSHARDLSWAAGNNPAAKGKPSKIGRLPVLRKGLPRVRSLPSPCCSPQPAATAPRRYRKRSRLRIREWLNRASTGCTTRSR